MCGIIGQISDKPIDKEHFCQMRDTLYHRGPDGSGLYLSKDGCTALGHRRLSIIDLSENASQPMCNEDGTLWITYNGEIYNYSELKKQLLSKGHVFKSSSDTEAILHAFEEWGVDCLNRLRGMYAFGIWNEKQKMLFLARDPIGIKPLYYYNAPGNFIFSSELKAIVEGLTPPPEIDFSSLADYFQYRYIPSPKSIWKNIQKLQPGSFLTYENNSIVKTKYWTPPQEDDFIDTSDVLIRLEELLCDSITVHMLADVPVGLLLSGGIDSSTLAYYLNKQKKSVTAFSMGFDVDNWQNELPYARQVAEDYGLELIEDIAKLDVLDLLSYLVWYFDEPFGDTSMLPSFLLAKNARKHVKAVIGGDGGDELFAGYNYYFEAQLHDDEKYSLGIFKKTRCRRAAEIYRQTIAKAFEGSLLKLFPTDIKKQLRQNRQWFIESYYNEDIPLPKRLQIIDIQTILPEQFLTKIDRAGMANSLEVRVPFLDMPLVEYVLRLSSKIIPHDNQQKYLLKKLMTGKLSDNILNKRKRGFSIPLSSFWSKRDFLDRLIDGPVANDGIYKRKNLIKITKNDSQVSMDQLWLMLVFDQWYKEWVTKR